MFFTVKPQRAFRSPPGAEWSRPTTNARAHDKEISFALVPMEEAQARGAAGRGAGRSDNRT
jgi:hypothetical protein